MSDADYRIDGLESRISSLEDDLRSQISSERYETEREIANVESRIRSTDRELSELHSRIVDLESLNQESDRTVGELDGRIVEARIALDKRIDALTEATAHAHERIDALSLRCGVTT